MNWRCKKFGHKYGEGRFEQNCTRKDCLAWRSLMENPYPKIGEARYEWKEFNVPSEIKP